MKYILFIFLISSFKSFSQKEIILRTDSLNGKSYSIRYEVDTTHWMETLVGHAIFDSAGNYLKADTEKWYLEDRHYDAEISVYYAGHLINKKPIYGKYVPHRCFEDCGNIWIKKAINDSK